MNQKNDLETGPKNKCPKNKCRSSEKERALWIPYLWRESHPVMCQWNFLHSARHGTGEAVTAGESDLATAER